ncbi:hypothetical protein WUBG_11620 [Wuchereria bancrofti]|uniref:Uncharacterized protein n=1 Tax=Wuchereria bancrofti TaxID=6293 RepID=J9E5P2_WUCBA|nr:hypothetical protein WUBG_11620 [Wuchereria bancrofti]
MAMMQPGQQPVQIASGQYVQNPQMQPRLLTMSDALSRLPPEVQQMAQQQINAETSAEKKTTSCSRIYTGTCPGKGLALLISF